MKMELVVVSRRIAFSGCVPTGPTGTSGPLAEQLVATQLEGEPGSVWETMISKRGVPYVKVFRKTMFVIWGIVRFGDHGMIGVLVP